MTLPKFSGRTSCYEHKFDSLWEKAPKNHGEECIRNVKFSDAQWSNCPVEVETEVKKMWRDWELGNDHYIIKWDWDLEEDYPIVSEFLKSKGLTEKDEIIIHWWW
jgi:hypothetical protein